MLSDKEFGALSYRVRWWDGLSYPQKILKGKAGPFSSALEHLDHGTKVNNFKLMAVRASRGWAPWEQKARSEATLCSGRLPKGGVGQENGSSKHNQIFILGIKYKERVRESLTQRSFWISVGLGAKMLLSLVTLRALCTDWGRCPLPVLFEVMVTLT